MGPAVRRADHLQRRHDRAEPFRPLPRHGQRSRGAAAAVDRAGAALGLDRHADRPDGWTYHARDWMDSDGIDPDPVLIDLVMTVAGDAITFDLSGSAQTCRGPFNAPFSSTMSALMIGVKHVFPDVPINAGCFEPFTIVAPVGSLFNPLPPAPVSGTTTETSQRLVGLTMAVLGQAIPDRVPAAAFGTGTNIGMGGTSSSRGRYATIFFGGGYGAHRDQDGLTNGSAVISASRNSSVEVLERTVPILFTRYAIREDSAGDGEFCGGFGVEIDFHLRDGGSSLTLVGDRGRFGPQGVAGRPLVPGRRPGFSGRTSHEDRPPSAAGRGRRPPAHAGRRGLRRSGAP